MASSPENHMHLRPGPEMKNRFLDRQQIINQLEQVARQILEDFASYITITCAHSPSLISPDRQYTDQFYTDPIQVKTTPQAGPLPRLIVELTDADPSDMKAIHRYIELMLLDSDYIVLPSYPRQTGEEESSKKTRIEIGLQDNRHRTVS